MSNSDDTPWHCKQIPNGSEPIVVCERQDLLNQIERLRARLAEYEGQTQSALTPEDIGMVPERNVMVDVAGVKIRCRAVEDLWRFPDE